MMTPRGYDGGGMGWSSFLTNDGIFNAFSDRLKLRGVRHRHASEISVKKNRRSSLSSHTPVHSGETVRPVDCDRYYATHAALVLCYRRMQV